MLPHVWTDCHTHAFPKPSELWQRLSPSLRRLKDSRALPWLMAQGQKWRNKIPLSFPTLPIDVESIAKFRESVSGEFSERVEWILSFGLLPQILFRGAVSHLLEAMETSGIKRSIVIAAPPLATNEWLLEALKEKKDAEQTLIPVVTLPKLHTNATLDEWCFAFEQLVTSGVAGFKIHPNLDRLEPNHLAYKALFEVAQIHRKFIILHTGCFNVPGYGQASADPKKYERYFKKFSDVHVLLAHMNRDNPQVAWLLMNKYDQLYADTSWQATETIKKAIQKTDSNRIVLGSDWPLLHEHLQRDAVSILRRATNDDEFEKIIAVNAGRFLRDEQLPAQLI